MKDWQRKNYLASVTDRYVNGRMDRRSFLRSAGKLGLSVGALGMGFGMGFGWLWMIIILVLVGLTIAALVKYLRK